ncbi:MAG: type IV toxin-antitoxin system AbiEi family antitoxin domain-containing protein [Sphingomicrobium sp.]
MTLQKVWPLNQLRQQLPAGFLADSRWFADHGISRSRVHDYVKNGWLERVGPRVYRRLEGPHDASELRWEIAVLSAQANQPLPLHIGGPTALDLLGLSHFLDLGRKTRIWLYDPSRTAPPWLDKLPTDVELSINRRKLFGNAQLGLEWRPLELTTGRVGPSIDPPPPVEFWQHVMRLSGPERATLEMLDDVGKIVGFNSADKLFEGLANLRPALLLDLLQQCTSVKTKRLFFFFSDRHRHAWAKRIDPTRVDLGSGKRQIVKGGRLDPKYQITVPAEFLEDSEDPNAG